MRRKHQRHEQLRGVALQSHGDDDHHRQEGGDGAVETDDGGQQRTERHHEDEQPRAAVLARLLDQELARPCGDAGLFQCRRNHEERRDEHHRRIAIAGKRIRQRQDAGGPERKADGHGHDDHRQLVRYKQHDRRDDDQTI